MRDACEFVLYVCLLLHVISVGVLVSTLVLFVNLSTTSEMMGLDANEI